MLTVAGRFWVAYALLLIGVLGFVGKSYAGYYATISTSNYSPVVVGRSSSCMLTAGMAIQSASNVTTSITSIDMTAHTFSAYYANSPSSSWTGVVGTCTASAAGGSVPTYVGGVSEPAYVSGGIGTGGGGSYVEEPFDYVKAAAVFTFFFSFVVGVWYVCKNMGMILSAIKHW